MTEIVKRTAFDTAIYPFDGRIRKLLISLPLRIKNEVEEIRIRAEKPLMLTVSGASMFLSEDASVGLYPSAKTVYITKAELGDIYYRLCNCSVYSHTSEIKNGFIVMKNGHRAGIGGTYAPNGTLAEISSLNIRVAKQIFGCAEKLAEKFYGGMLIAGPPGSGKTTLLRDCIRLLSEKSGKRVAVIDSRGEIAALSEGIPQNDIGPNTDVITGVGKAEGIDMAVRTLSPGVIAFDEIGSQGEIDAVIRALNSGVGVLTTAHIGSKDDLCRREITKKLIKSGAISDVAVLSSRAGKIEFLQIGEMLTV